MRRSLGPSKAVVALLALALSLLCVTPAAADHVQCGDVITQDMTLDSDLIDCPGDGIVIGADGVRLNLAGHTIDGIPEVGDTYGVRADGFNDLVVRNGFVTGFFYGASLGTSGSFLRGLTVTSCCGGNLGIGVSGDGNRVERNETRDGGGALFVSGDRNLVSRNVVASQSNDSWLSVAGDGSAAVHNEVRGVGGAVCSAFDFYGFDHGLIAHNTISGIGPGRVGEGECFGFVGNANGTRLRMNVATGVDTGYGVSGNLLLVGNVASYNNWDGISGESRCHTHPQHGELQRQSGNQRLPWRGDRRPRQPCAGQRQPGAVRWREV
jgi:hypothetical protein